MSTQHDDAITTIDSTRTWRLVEERLGRETDPRVRRNLETLLENMRAEAAGDLDRLMQTVSAEVRYVAHGSGPEYSPVGKDAVRAFYEGVISSGIGRLQFDVDRLVADGDSVVAEGVMRMAWPGTTLAAVGIEVDDRASDYLHEGRMAIFWGFDADGLVVAQDSYTGTDGLAGIAERKLPAGC